MLQLKKKLCSFSYVVSNVNMEKILSDGGNLWTNEHNRLTDSHIPFTCLEVKGEEILSKHSNVIKDVMSIIVSTFLSTVCFLLYTF